MDIQRIDATSFSNNQNTSSYLLRVPTDILNIIISFVGLVESRTLFGSTCKQMKARVGSCNSVLVKKYSALFQLFKNVAIDLTPLPSKSSKQDNAIIYLSPKYILNLTTQRLDLINREKGAVENSQKSIGKSFSSSVPTEYEDATFIHGFSEGDLDTFISGNLIEVYRRSTKSFTSLDVKKACNPQFFLSDTIKQATIRKEGGQFCVPLNDNFIFTVSNIGVVALWDLNTGHFFKSCALFRMIDAFQAMMGEKKGLLMTINCALPYKDGILLYVAAKEPYACYQGFYFVNGETLEFTRFKWDKALYTPLCKAIPSTCREFILFPKEDRIECLKELNGTLSTNCVIELKPKKIISSKGDYFVVETVPELDKSDFRIYGIYNQKLISIISIKPYAGTMPLYFISNEVMIFIWKSGIVEFYDLPFGKQIASLDLKTHPEAKTLFESNPPTILNAEINKTELAIFYQSKEGETSKIGLITLTPKN